MHILRNEPLDRRNTLRLGASAAAFVALESSEQLPAALQWSQGSQLQMLPLGEGSNVVFAGDVQALLVKMASRGVQVLERSVDKVLLRVEAGENWHNFVQWTLQQRYYGLENLALIPGAVGAAPVQNIGAYGIEIADYLHAVHIFDMRDGAFWTLTAAECEFAYRDSIFKRELCDQVVICAVDICLNRHENPRASYPALVDYFAAKTAPVISAQSVFDAVVNIRRSKLPDPAITPNVGSFFKNPLVSLSRSNDLKQLYPALPCFDQPDGQVKLSAAWMIEFCGWKGRQRNGVGVHDQHALVLVNLDNSSGKTLLDFAQALAADVAAQFGIELAIEPRIYGSYERL